MVLIAAVTEGGAAVIRAENAARRACAGGECPQRVHISSDGSRMHMHRRRACAVHVPMAMSDCRLPAVVAVGIPTLRGM